MYPTEYHLTKGWVVMKLTKSKIYVGDISEGKKSGYGEIFDKD